LGKPGTWAFDFALFGLRDCALRSACAGEVCLPRCWLNSPCSIHSTAQLEQNL
jgi:hypothetical protein